MAVTSRHNFHRTITDRFLAAMDAAARDNRCPWHARGGHLHVPRSVATGRSYTGVNILALWAEAVLQGFDAGTAGTRRDWRAAGARILKDARPVVLVGRHLVSSARDGEWRRYLVRPCPVFLIEQTDRYTPFFGDDPPCMTEIMLACDAWLAGAGATIAAGAGRDRQAARQGLVRLPQRRGFRDTPASSAVESFYAAAFRAVGQRAWGRAGDRRNLEPRFGARVDAAGELATELFAAFACARFGVRNAARPGLARHIEGWRDLLRHDARALGDAASMAERALRRVDALGTTEPCRTMTEGAGCSVRLSTWNMGGGNGSQGGPKCCVAARLA